MVVMCVNASEKKLRVKLEREYDLQLAHKQKEIESRKLLQSVAKNHKKINIHDDQRKNIESNKKLEIKQQQNRQRNIKLSDKHLRNIKNNSDLKCIIDFFVIFVCFPLAVPVMARVVDGVPIGCYYSGNVCKCYYM